MAIIPESQYPGKITPASTAYPYGQARNITLPGDGTGTPWEAALVNDIFGFQQALLTAASVVPSGDPEAANASQYLEAIRIAFLPKADSVAEIKAITVTSGAKKQVSLSGSREGVFAFDPADLSAEVTADPREGLFIAPDSDATGASGAWVRQFSGTPSILWFGAARDGVTDVTAIIKDAINAIASTAYTNHPAALFFPHGRYLVSSTIPVTGGVSLFGESSNSSRIVVKRPFSGNVFENNAGGSYWIVKNLYGVHDVEASDSIAGAFLYCKDMEFYYFENVVAQMHGELAYGIDIDGQALGAASTQGMLINISITGEAAGGTPYNPAWDPTANAARRAGIRLGNGAKNCTILGPFVESSFAGILFIGSDADGKVTKNNIAIGGTINTCDRCYSFGESAQNNTVMQTELIAYPSTLYADDVDSCKQNMAYNVRPFGETGFSTFIKRNYLEFIGGSPTNPLKKIYGTDIFESDNESLILNKTTSDGAIAQFRRQAAQIAIIEVTANSLTLRHAETSGSVNLSGGNSSGNGGNVVLRGSTGGDDVQVRVGSKTVIVADEGVPAANETGFLVRYNNGSVETLGRVSVGAPDSGGTGFRALRVPN